MSGSAVVLYLNICLIAFFLLLFSYQNVFGQVRDEEKWYINLLLESGTDIIKSTYGLIEEVEYIKQNHLNSPAFEVGYVMFTIFEKYRKMIDKYNSSMTLNRVHFNMELLMYLEEIEVHHWEVDHLAAQNLNHLYNGTIYNELSWPVKVLLMKDRLNETKLDLTRVARKNIEDDGPTDAGTKYEVVTSNDKTPSVNSYPRRRMPTIEALVAERRQETPKDPNEDDNSMRLKLFRLMYETIRDSDLKCKRAELIRANYENSSTFEVGYLMGDVMDKYNIMSDISMTLNRLFHEWKPIEHINAYEQISNQAIEINHLIEMMKSISKKKDDDKKSKL